MALLMNEHGELYEPEPADRRREVYASLAKIDTSKLMVEEPMKLDGHERTCPTCGKVFISTQGKRYCSMDCRKEAAAERERRRRMA